MTTPTTHPALTVNSKVVVDSGCQARGVHKGTRATVTKVEEGEGRCARVVLAFSNGVTQVWWARHMNRLSDAFPAMNDGNPLHRITVRRA